MSVIYLRVTIIDRVLFVWKKNYIITLFDKWFNYTSGLSIIFKILFNINYFVIVQVTGSIIYQRKEFMKELYYYFVIRK